MSSPVDPLYFPTPARFRAWLKRNHRSASELWVGFYKKGSGTPSITWPEAVDEALCVGWIDGLRRRVDDERYQIRFTPRRASSTWSTVNIARMKELAGEDRVQATGAEVFERRSPAKSGIYAYEQRAVARLDAAAEREFRSHESAWRYFAAQPPWYRKTAIWRVVSAKREDTRKRRLAQLIECSAGGRPIPELKRERG